MANLIARVHDRGLFVDATTVDILDPDTMEEFEHDYELNGIVSARPAGDAAAVITATEIGRLVMTAELWDVAPPLVVDDWEDVAEVPVRWTTSVMEIGGEGSSLAYPPTFPIAEPGAYRIRASGRNRDGNDLRDEGEPVEEYLIQVWPAPARAAAVAGPVVHKLTSRVGIHRTREKRDDPWGRV